MKYKVKAILAVEYEVEADNVSDAEEVAKGYLLEEIDQKNVAYGQLKAEVDRVQPSKAEHELAMSKVLRPCYCDYTYHAGGC